MSSSPASISRAATSIPCGSPVCYGSNIRSVAVVHEAIVIAAQDESVQARIDVPLENCSYTAPQELDIRFLVMRRPLAGDSLDLYIPRRIHERGHVHRG